MDEIEEFRYLVLAVQREGNRVFAARLKPLGITPAQSEVLRVLSERQPLSMSDLGELLICESSGSPSRLVDRLVASGHVSRDPGADRRSVRLQLTGSGTRLAEQIGAAESELYAALEPALRGQPLDATLQTLRSVAAGSSAGRALARRIG